MKSVIFRAMMRCFLCAFALLFLGHAFAGAQVPTKDTPDVQIVVFPMPDGTWMMTSVYPRRIRQAEAETRVRRMLSAGGWKGSGFTFEDKALERATTRVDLPPPPVMSSLTFQVAGNVVDTTDGTMPLEPVARGFRDLKRVYITYMVPGKFAFRGVRNYSDKNLDITLSEGQGAWTYLLKLKNHNFDALSLPRYETLKPGTAVEMADARPGVGGVPPAVLGTGIALLLATGAGVVAYLIFNRVQAR